MSWSIALKESFCECISCYVVISMYYNVQKLKQYTNVDTISNINDLFTKIKPNHDIS